MKGATAVHGSSSVLASRALDNLSNTRFLRLSLIQRRITPAAVQEVSVLASVFENTRQCSE